jgi:CRP/FNR family transcriptional regulator
MKQLIEERVSPRSSAYPAFAYNTPAQVRPASRPQVAGEPQGTRLHLAPHAFVFHEDDEANRIYQLVDGAVMLYKLLPDGRRQVVELIGPGDVFGLSSLPVHDCAAETLVESNVVAYDRNAAEKSESFMRRLNARMHAQICALHNHAVLLGRKSALERVASFIMRYVPGRGLGQYCSGPRGKDDSADIRLGMTRQEMADFLGLTIETVSRSLSELKRRSVIKIDKQDRIHVSDVCRVCKLTGAH